MNNPRHTPEYQAYRKKVMAAARAGLIPNTCHRCGQPIDLNLKGNDPLGPTLEHTHPLSHGGELTPTLEDAALSHARCNQSHGGRIGSTRKKSKPVFSQTDGNSRAPSFSSPKAQSGPEWDANGLVVPRLVSDVHPAAVGSYGGECRDWLEKVYGMKLRDWQAFAVDRALEHDANGDLVWAIVVLTVARQSGKSWIARGVNSWRCMEGPGLFGEEQLVLHVANRTSTAFEVMMPAGVWAEQQFGRGAFVKGNTRPGITYPNGSRWLVQAANLLAGVGYSVSQAFVDEAAQVARDVYETAIRPTMAERSNPQTWLVSTAGSKESELMAAYREKAIDRIGTGDPGNILILEWSAPQESDPNDPETWRWASPEWNPRRAEVVQQAWETMSLESFRTQFLNQWVVNIGHWLTDELWSDAETPGTQLPADGMWHVVVEQEFDGSAFAVAVAAVTDGDVIIKKWLYRRVQEVDAAIARLRREHPSLSLYACGTVTHFIADTNHTVLGRRESAAHTAAMLRAFRDRTVKHDGDEVLRQQLSRTRIANTQDGHRLVAAAGAVDTCAARAVMYAIGEATKSPAPTPMVASRKRA